jgi:hypothetical protein
MEAASMYEWVIGTGNKSLYQVKGLARGFPVSSFLAESYGELVTTTFLQRLRELHLIKTNNKYNFFCNNQGF